MGWYARVNVHGQALDRDRHGRIRSVAALQKGQAPAQHDAYGDGSAGLTFRPIVE
jgi:hypothetical protein